MEFKLFKSTSGEELLINPGQIVMVKRLERNKENCVIHFTSGSIEVSGSLDQIKSILGLNQK